MEKKFLILLTYVVIWTHTALLVCGEERGIKQADDTGKYLDANVHFLRFFLIYNVLYSESLSPANSL